MTRNDSRCGNKTRRRAGKWEWTYTWPRKLDSPHEHWEWGRSEGNRQLYLRVGRGVVKGGRFESVGRTK